MSKLNEAGSVDAQITSFDSRHHNNHHNQPQQQPRIYPLKEGIESSKTLITYERCFNQFLDHIKIHDLQVLLDFSQKVIKQMLVDYVLYLRDEKPGKKLSRTSIKVHLAAILHFFQINNDDFNLTTRNFRIHFPSDESVKDDRPYTTEEIGLVLHECDLRSKVIILLLCSTGMRMGALHSLLIGDLENISKYNISKVQVYARTREKYLTFNTPECNKAIADYLGYRKRCGDQLDYKSPLIREQFNRDNPFTANAPKFVSEKGIEHIIDNVLKRSGVRKPREVHLSHGFRKHFMTQCELSGMKSINVETLMGHNTGVSGRYYKPNELEILQDYMTYAVDALTIDPAQRLQTKVKKLETEHSEELRSVRSELQSMKGYINELSEEWVFFSKPDWDILKKRLPDLMKLLKENKQ